MNLCNHIHQNGMPCTKLYGHGQSAGIGIGLLHSTARGELWGEVSPGVVLSGESLRLACICEYRDADDQPVDFCPVHDNSEAKLWELCDCCVMREPTEALLTVIDRGWDGINVDANGWCDVAGGTQLCSDCTETYLARLWPPGFLGLWYKGVPNDR